SGGASGTTGTNGTSGSGGGTTGGITCVPSEPVVPLDTCEALGASIGADFASDYSCWDMGAPPGVPLPLGGVIGVPGDPNRLIVAGNAGTPEATLYSVGVARDADCRILGFDGSPPVLWSTAPDQVGDLVFAPGDVLIYSTEWPEWIGQIKPGSSSPDRVDEFPGLGPPLSKAFVPAGFANAGDFKVAGPSAGDWNTIDLVPDGNGTYDLVPAGLEGAPPFASFGMSYVAAGSPQILEPSILYTVNHMGIGAIIVFPVGPDAVPDSNPSRYLVNGVTDPEGSYLDPLSGQFFFTVEFFGDARVLVVEGFEPQ
ncbi:MAG: hypothetical protein D6705_13680, partial [Deltaproteobacteria bacterium]